jgi:phosphohistidine phosphatase
MRRLYILRHAKTETAEPGRPDRARALVERGREDAGKIGAYMASHRLIPERIGLSPAVRTQETWKYMAAAMAAVPPAAPDPMTVEKFYDANADGMFDLIAGTPADIQSLLIVGHNPALYDLAQMLVASGDIDARERLREGLPTMGLVIIDFAFDDWDKLHPRSGRLERFVTPKSLDPATR